MRRVDVAAISFTNAKPFVYGLQNTNIHNKIKLRLYTPSQCAKQFINGTVDVGLIPVTALLETPTPEIITDYCISANGAVNSVFVFSDKPLHMVKRIRMDSQSETSNALAKILFKHYWKINHVDFAMEGPADAFIQIGDQTFGKENSYSYTYDLAQAWTNLTNLPFCFAVWASNKPLEQSFLSEFNNALNYGCSHIQLILAGLPKYQQFDLEDYLLRRIDFKLDKQKRQALREFLRLTKELC